ncbi:MAG TPA: MotA/TolQ/ExbB proton channel family protein [Candidatus Limnocylindria bacterium]|jgi:biopolymer transport protein ExbB/TolQ|nr:MotA/TolQ/ExbB proton channel family protein [Candidatus Limnocylindria bacterium]
MSYCTGLLASAGGGVSLSYVWQNATAEAKVIIAVLLVFSIFAWSVMLSKAMQMRRATRLNRYFEQEFRGQSTVLAIYDRQLPVDGCPLFAVYEEGCKDLEGHLKMEGGTRKQYLSLKSMEHVKRTLEGAVARESLRLESGLILLALAVSGAPFLGLLGTVWGVMDAFGGVARAAQAGQRADLAAMAPGVSAALITTVAGLLVAIPSMFGYNYLVHNLRVQSVELDNFAQSLASRMETEFLKDDE